MPHRIDIVKDPGYILVEQFGNVTTDDVELIRGEIFEVVAREGLFRVAVDVRNQINDYSITEMFNMTVDHAVAETPFPKPRICLLVRPDQEDNAKFIENVGMNRGMTIRYFTDRDSGLNWLMD